MSSLADLPELVGFFSYSREDDEDSMGALSALRERIQRELRAQLGRSIRTFRLWQDKEAIAPGKLWEDEIRAAVAQAAFFIPIVTPTAVQSPFCLFEFNSFLAREQALGRCDLVFPILYIRVPDLEDISRQQSQPVLSIIAKRQYVDWRELRHGDVNSTEVKRAIAQFCAHIGDTLRAPWLSPEERRCEGEAEARRRAEEEQRQQERAREAATAEAEARRKAEEEERKQAEAARLAAEGEQRTKAAEQEQERAEEERRGEQAEVTQPAKEEVPAKLWLPVVSVVALVALVSLALILRPNPQSTPEAVQLAERGYAALVRKNYDQAIADYTEAIRVDPKYRDSYYRRGLAYHEGKQDYDHAIADYNEVIRLDPNFAFAFLNRGQAYAGKGQYDRAITDFNEAIRLDPNTAFAFLNRGRAYGTKGQYDSAISDLNEAIRLDPNTAFAFLYRGQAYATKGQYDRAIADFNEAIRLDPNFALAFYFRGMVKKVIGDTAGGEPDIASAKALDPNVGK
jgi:tetratricopeptide (TPR) repeat protein